MSNFVTPEQFAAANKANIETLLTLANTAFCCRHWKTAWPTPRPCWLPRTSRNW